MTDATDPKRSYTVQLGKDVRIPMDSVLKCPLIEIGDHTRINGPINIRGQADCIIEKYCAFGYGIHLLTTNHALEYANIQVAFNRRHGFVGLEEAKGNVAIGNNVWLGDNVTVLSGVQIGSGTIVGAGSVITKDIPPFAVVYGIPGKVVRLRFAESIIQELLDVNWWDWSDERIARNKQFFNTDLTTWQNEIHKIIKD